mgnify:CR=1 FL=1
MIDSILIITEGMFRDPFQQFLRCIGHQEPTSGCFQHFHIIIIIPESYRILYFYFPEIAEDFYCLGLYHTSLHDLKKCIGGFGYGILGKSFFQLFFY